ncbi:MAG: peptide deformylase [Gammaproteobacteria bacterium AqS3]|nr:peptide deformylase [Gammaproteobacteria bacterium AqS3]
MTIRTILQYPDPRLRTIAREVEKIDDGIRELIADMFETLYAAGGIGLAATQIDVHLAVIVIDLTEKKKSPHVFINPKITVLDDRDRGVYKEGCLSVPEFQANVKRPKQVRVQCLNENGEALDFKPEGLLAVCLQHEIDHLNGKLFVDHLSLLRRSRISRALRKRSA